MYLTDYQYINFKFKIILNFFMYYLFNFVYIQLQNLKIPAQDQQDLGSCNFKPILYVINHMKLINYIPAFLIIILTGLVSCSKDKDQHIVIYPPPPPDTIVYNQPLDLLLGQTWVITQYSIQNQINPINSLYILNFDDSSSIHYSFNGDSTSNYYLYKPQPLNKYTLRLDNTPWGNIQNNYLTDYNFTQGQIPGAEFINIYNPNSKVFLWIEKIP